MIGYWLNHPGAVVFVFRACLSGPTSQAPRVDETRADSLYELEIAFGQIPEPEKAKCRLGSWIGFFGTFSDLTGNTHRAEFCIDKL